MPTIFMCYRRDDTRHVAGRVYDRLAAKYGNEEVFRDLDDIPSGVDHIEASEAALRSAKAFVALIGKEWLTAEDDEGKLRIRQPGDRVRIEIEIALKHDVAIFPVLVEGAAMPKEKELPPSIAAFYRPNAAPLDSQSFDYHVEQLLNDLERVAGVPAAKPRKGRGPDAEPIDPSGPVPPPRLAIVGVAIGMTFCVAAFGLFGFTLFTMDRELGEEAASGPAEGIVIAGALFFVGFVIFLATAIITTFMDPRTARFWRVDNRGP